MKLLSAMITLLVFCCSVKGQNSLKKMIYIWKRVVTDSLHP